MQMLKATEIRKSWGNKPCDHSHLAKEYHFGTATGDMSAHNVASQDGTVTSLQKRRPAKKEKDK
jgi:hypothetical protein